jgi:chromosome partitioning protein
MAKIITILNQKDGVGKTTTAINLGSYLANLGKMVLLVDIDPQANATSGLGVNHRQLQSSIYDVLLLNKAVEDVIIKIEGDNFYILPSHVNLAGANIELVGMIGREFKLAKSLESVRSKWDYVLIDCPPSLGLLTINGMVAGDTILIPVQSEYYALEGLAQLLSTINLVQTHLKPSLDILGAVVTMYDSRQLLAQQVHAELNNYFPNKVFKSIIPRSVRLAEAPSYGQSILRYNPSSSAAQAYEELAQEIINVTTIINY